MTELFPVEVTAPDLPIAGDRPVVFHGVNKSGSLAMANVMRDAYDAAGRSDEFISHYHKRPLEFDDFADALRNAEGPGFFVAHSIYGRIELPPDALLVTQLRHPLPRALSMYGWFRRKHLQRHGTLEAFPSLHDWAVRGAHKAHSQMSHLAVGFPEDRGTRIKAMAPAQMRERALDCLQRDFAWFGIAERFEESIVALAHICGLPGVPAWEKDTRNQGRPAIAATDDEILDVLREKLSNDFDLYQGALATFSARLDGIRLGASFDDYKERCRDEYGERLDSVAPRYSCTTTA